MRPRSRDRRRLAAALALAGIALVAVRPAHAEWPTFDALTHTLLQQAQRVLNQAITRVYDNITNIGDLIGDRITGMSDRLNGQVGNVGTQISNYQRAQIGAVMQVADASNTANARYQRDIRNVQIRDEHMVSPEACLALDAAQAAGQSEIQARRLGQTIAAVMDNRGEAGPGTPAWFGEAQSVAAANNLHFGRYCDQDEAAANLCTVSATPNGDIRATSLWREEAYAGEVGVNAANDYATNLVQPVVPAAIRGDQLASVQGRDAAARRRGYDARMSLARSGLTHQIALGAPSVVLNNEQRAMLTARGITPPANGSWLQVMGLEVERRFTDAGWTVSLQTMTPAAVSRDIAQQLALSNYIGLQNLRVNLQLAAVNASQLAIAAESGLPRGGVPMPSPSIAAN